MNWPQCVGAAGLATCVMLGCQGSPHADALNVVPPRDHVRTGADGVAIDSGKVLRVLPPEEHVGTLRGKQECARRGIENLVADAEKLHKMVEYLRSKGLSAEELRAMGVRDMCGEVTDVLDDLILALPARRMEVEQMWGHALDVARYRIVHRVPGSVPEGATSQPGDELRRTGCPREDASCP